MRVKLGEPSALAKDVTMKKVCSKCGHDDIHVRYEGPIEWDPCWYDRKYSPPGKWPEHEYLHHTCKKCGYDWPEDVVAHM